MSKLSRYFEQLGYHVTRLLPTGVAAYNVHGETIDRFFGMTNERKEVNKLKLNDHVKLYKKSIFLIDEFSMISRECIENISSALIQVTGRNCVFGGIAVVFFGDVGQLLPIDKMQNFIWKS